MRIPMGVIVSLVVASALILQAAGLAVAGCPPNCDPVAPPKESSSSKEK